ncbi:MAG: hypothetical protein M3Z57_04995 [Candidatus Dormibacteraeota bacterium]|nr:hypothetical protein [Candidatus Dormibacteraeota bacterium]
MATKKRRRPAKSRTAAVAAAEPQVAVAALPVADAKRVRSRRPPAPAVGDLRDVPWTARGLLALLGMAFVLQIPVGAIIHLTQRANPLIIDMFFFQPQYLVIACVLVMPLARRLTGQPRNLRLLESLSLGVMYALVALMLSTVFVHPANGNQTSDQFIRSLKLSDGLLIALSDVIALFGTVTLYPGFSRLLGAPARRARARMLERAASGRTDRKPSDATTSAKAATSKPRSRPKR